MLAHERLVAEGRESQPGTGIRSVVRASWERSLSLHLDPDAQPGGLDLEGDELREYRSAHPLAAVLPIVHRLLIHHAFESGLIVAIGDEAGRLLWIDGDRGLRRKAEQMLFAEGANWSERRMGTSAPGTALALDHGIQIQGAEHFARSVHPWSCTAVPVHDPVTRAVLGVIDITGGDDAVATQTLPLLEATVAAVEGELRLRRLDAAGRSAARPTGFTRRAAGSRRQSAPVLHVLHRTLALLEVDGVSVELSPRHSEILTLLAWHRDGLSASHLANLVYDGVGASVTLRPEMVRLRRVLQAVDPRLVPLSRPYRLSRRLELDTDRVLALLERGAHRVALASYPGSVLPASTAPGIATLRDDVGSRLRDALLGDAASETLLAYARTPDAALDIEVWTTALRLLPARSPKRAAVVGHIERIEWELGARYPRATSLQPPAF